MKVSSICISALGIVMALAGSAGAAVYTVDSLVETGTLYEDAGNCDNRNSTVTVDYWVFHVAAAGIVTVDVLSNRVLDGDWGPQGLSNANTYLRLYDYDPTGDLGLLGAHRAVEDDDTTGAGRADGSISDADGFLRRQLQSGGYVLAVSEWWVSRPEARAGVNATHLVGSSWGDYQLTFSGITTEPYQVDEVGVVPLPAALTMLLAGLGGLTIAARRRR